MCYYIDCFDTEIFTSKIKSIKLLFLLLLNKVIKISMSFLVQYVHSIIHSLTDKVARTVTLKSKLAFVSGF